MLKTVTVYNRKTNDIIGKAFGTDEQRHEYLGEIYKSLADRSDIRVKFDDSVHSLNFIYNKERVKMSFSKLLRMFK